MAALDAVRDYEADPNVMLEDVPSGKNIRKIHTIWYVIIPCPKMV
jgi:hypothetical protein